MGLILFGGIWLDLIGCVRILLHVVWFDWMCLDLIGCGWLWLDLIGFYWETIYSTRFGFGWIWLESVGFAWISFLIGWIWLGLTWFDLECHVFAWVCFYVTGFSGSVGIWCDSIGCEWIWLALIGFYWAWLGCLRFDRIWLELRVFDGNLMATPLPPTPERWSVARARNEEHTRREQTRHKKGWARATNGGGSLPRNGVQRAANGNQRTTNGHAPFAAKNNMSSGEGGAGRGGGGRSHSQVALDRQRSADWIGIVSVWLCVVGFYRIWLGLDIFYWLRSDLIGCDGI